MVAGACVAAVAFCSLWPCLDGGFFNFDDAQTIVENVSIRSLGWRSLVAQLRELQFGGLWSPLRFWTHAVEFALWGANPFGYHLTALSLHALNTVLLWRVILELLPKIAPARTADEPAIAALGALAYGAHPMRAEVVAWASLRSYLLVTGLCLASVLAYLRATAPAPAGPQGGAPGRGRRAGWWAASLASYALSLMAYPIAVSLPAILLVLDVYPLRRAGGGRGWRTAILEKLPYLALGALSVAAALAARQAHGRVVGLGDFGVAQRLAQALTGAALYLEKTLLPVGYQYPYYFLPNEHLFRVTLGPLDPPFKWRCLATVLLALGAWLTRRRAPGLACAAAAYLAAYLPVSGLMKHDIAYQYAANWWAYFPMLVPSVAVSGWLASRGRRLVRACWVAVALAAALSWRHANLWNRSESVWRHQLALQAACWDAHAALGEILRDQGRWHESLLFSRSAIDLLPLVVNPWAAAVRTYAMMGDAPGALPYAERLRVLRPDIAAGERARYFQEAAAAAGRPWGAPRALALARVATALEPSHVEARLLLAAQLKRSGGLDEAIGHARAALALAPAHAPALWGLAGLLQAKGEPAEARALCAAAVRLSRDAGDPCRGVLEP